MANDNQEILDLIDGLTGEGDDLPGLSVGEVAENFVDVKYGSELEKVKDEKERKELRDKWLKYYTEGEGRETLQLEIASIKSNYSAALQGINSVVESAASTVETNTIPSVITVGTATSTPNPAYALAENKTKKNQLMATLNMIGTCIINLLKSAISIAFSIPTAIIGLIESFRTAKSTVESIPV